MLTLIMMEKSSSPKLLHNNNNKVNNNQVKKSRQEIEQFSERLSTALRRNRNPENPASTKLFRKVFVDDDNFPARLFSSHALRKADKTRVVDVHHQVKDSWSLNECLEEINSIKYDNFITGIAHNSYEKSESEKDLLGFRNQRPSSIKQWGSPTATDRSDCHSIGLLSSEDELIFRDDGSISSTRSSISWAADAVEAKITVQLAMLWEDIELVCSGQVTRKPSGMSDTVFDECLLWKRAFPEKTEHPSRFSTMAMGDENGDDEDSTPTPTNTNSVNFGFDSPPVSANRASLVPFRADSHHFEFSSSRAENCATPNPNNSSEYVAAWLTESHSYQKEYSTLKTNEVKAQQQHENAFDDPAMPANHHKKESVSSYGMVHIPSRPTTSSGNLITPIPTGKFPIQSRKNSGNSIRSDSGRQIRVRDPNLEETIVPITGTSGSVNPTSIQRKFLEESRKHSLYYSNSNLNPAHGATKSQAIKPKLPNLQFQGNSGIERPNTLRFRQNTYNNESEVESSPKSSTPFLLWLFDSTT